MVAVVVMLLTVVFVPVFCRPSPSPPPAPPGPLFHGCNTNVSKALPYCNTSLSYEARVANLVGSLNLSQKIAVLSPTEAPFCQCHTAPIDSIGKLFNPTKL